MIRKDAETFSIKQLLSDTRKVPGKYQETQKLHFPWVFLFVFIFNLKKSMQNSMYRNRSEKQNLHEILSPPPASALNI